MIFCFIKNHDNCIACRILEFIDFISISLTQISKEITAELHDISFFLPPRFVVCILNPVEQKKMLKWNLKICRVKCFLFELIVDDWNGVAVAVAGNTHAQARIRFQLKMQHATSCYFLCFCTIFYFFCFFVLQYSWVWVCANVKNQTCL